MDGDDTSPMGAGDAQNVAPMAGQKMMLELSRKYQHYLDQSTVHLKARWGAFGAMLLVFCLRVYMTQGFFIIAYGLGIFLLNMFIGFLSPQVDPENEGPVLPSKRAGGEFRPFSRRVPEFKFWYLSMKAVVISVLMTFFQMFNVPVFWPILLIYFIMLFFLTMKRQIKHMWKHQYVPWSSGKQSYGGKK